MGKAIPGDYPPISPDNILPNKGNNERLSECNTGNSKLAMQWLTTVSAGKSNRIAKKDSQANNPMAGVNTHTDGCLGNIGKLTCGGNTSCGDSRLTPLLWVEQLVMEISNKIADSKTAGGTTNTGGSSDKQDLKLVIIDMPQ